VEATPPLAGQRAPPTGVTRAGSSTANHPMERLLTVNATNPTLTQYGRSTKIGTTFWTAARALVCSAVIWRLVLCGAPAMACDDGHWIAEVMNDGSVIELEDGSIWLIDDIDRIYTALWLPISNIVACDDMLINTDDKEKVSAHKMRQ
jgi:hypothetical protein